MRVATSSIYSQGVYNMNNRQSDLFKLQNQLSTGRAILTPSDDPVASARSLDLGQAVSLNGQYIENNKYANDALSLTESNLQNVISAIQDIQQLAVQSGNPALTASEKRSIDADIKGKYQQLLGLANTTDGNGMYIFSGYKGDTKPFNELAFGDVRYDGDQGQRSVQISPSRQIPVSNSGTDVFVNLKTGNGTFESAMGKSGFPRTITVGDSGPIQISLDPATNGVVPGNYQVDWNAATGNYTFSRSGTPAVAAFTVTPAALAGAAAPGLAWPGSGLVIKAQGNPPTATTASTTFDGTMSKNLGTGVVSPGVVNDPLKWANANNNEHFRIQYHSVPDPTDSTKTITKYDIIDNDKSSANFNRSLIDGYNYTTDVPAGGRTDSAANPNSFPRTYTAGGDIILAQQTGENSPLYANWDFGGKVSVNGVPKDGDSFTIEPSVDKDLFSTLGDFSNALTSYTNNELGGAEFQNRLNTALSNLDGALTHILSVQSSIGSRQKEGGSVQNTNEDLNVQFKGTISKLTDLDYVKGISDFTQTQTYLDAARKSFSSIQNMTLFQYIS